MAQADRSQRTDAEVEAREALMRQQFERDAEAWETAIPAEEAMTELEAQINSKK
jgi:hypothetical protein